MNNWFENNGPPILIAIMGGIADFLMSDEHSLTNVIIAIFLSGFAGYLLFLFCSDRGYNDEITSIICGIGGMSSKTVLTLFKRSVLKRIQLFIMDKNND